MPRIIYGTAWKKDKTADLVVEAVLTGFRGIDTAYQPKHYQESLVGAALVKLAISHNIPRTELFLQTKFTPLSGQDPNNVPYDGTADIEAQVKQSIEKSLENLRTSYLDSLILHSPMRSVEETMKVWKVFEEHCGKGTVKQIGISNIYSLKVLEAVWKGSAIKPAVVQNRFYAETRYDRDIREFCRANGIIYQSFWTLTANPHILSHKSVRALASSKNCTVEQLFFRFVMQLGIVPLTGTKSKDHMMDDLSVLAMPELSDPELKLMKEFLGEI